MKVFWSRCGHGHGNFGDKLTPLFLDYFNLSYQWAPADEADLIGIGSLMEKVPHDFRGIIWTTGTMFRDTRKSVVQAEVLALRGELTLAHTVCARKDAVVLGDGALLCDLFHEPAPKRYKLGLIPHFADQKDRAVSLFATIDRNVTLIDICAPALDVIRQVAECEFILSSSLHGLILADSLGIPNHWMELGPATVLGRGFKFQDYYSVFGISKVRPVYLAGVETVDAVLSRCGEYRRPGIDEIKASLLVTLKKLVVRFGGNPDNGSLQSLKLRQQRTAHEQECWNAEVRAIIQAIADMIPPRERFVLIDDEQIRGDIKQGLPLPFVHHHGEYWGAPENDEHALKELEQHLAEGVRYVAIAACSFWWLQSYPKLAERLETRFTCRVFDETIRIFELRQ